MKQKGHDVTAEKYMFMTIAEQEYPPGTALGLNARKRI